MSIFLFQFVSEWIFKMVSTANTSSSQAHLLFSQVNFGKDPMEMRLPSRCSIRRHFLSGIQVEYKQSPHQRRLRARLYWLQVTLSSYSISFGILCLNFFFFSQGSIKGLDLIDRVPEEWWMEVHDIVQEVVIKTIPKKKKCLKAKWLSEEPLQIAEKTSERQRRKGKIYPAKCRIPKNGKER